MSTDTEPLAWSDWPARRAPGRAALAGAVIAVAVALVLTIDPLLALVGALLMLGATTEALLPSRYRLDSEGVHVERALWSQDVSWSKLRGWAPASDGYVLLGSGPHALLRRRRTVRLHCPQQREAVAALLQEYLP